MSDLISRQAAIEAIDKYLEEYVKGLQALKWCTMQEAKMVIQKLPSAEPETATIKIGRSKGGTTMWYECGACGEPVDVKDNYCRGCGRRLVHESR